MTTGNGQHLNTFLITFGIKAEHNHKHYADPAERNIHTAFTGNKWHPISAMFVHISNNLSGFSAVMRYYKQHFISYNGFNGTMRAFFGNLLKRFAFALMQPHHKDQ